LPFDFVTTIQRGLDAIFQGAIEGVSVFREVSGITIVIYYKESFWKCEAVLGKHFSGPNRKNSDRTKEPLVPAILRSLARSKEEVFYRQRRNPIGGL
jgi:hypothetical protein